MGKYTVVAGNYDRPAFVDGQRIEKNSGQTQLVGDQVKYTLRKQDIGVPNYAQAWGVRTYEDGQIPATPVEVKDPKYKGHVKFMPWGDPKGTLIECRYLKNYRTLDKQYQDLVLNAKINEDDPTSADAYFITLQSGENTFDDVVEAFKIQMLKISSYNKTSPFKTPDAVHWLFYEKDKVTEAKVESKVLSAKAEALMIVGNAAQDNTYGKLNNLLGIVRGITTDEPEEKEVYVYLQRLADNYPDLFITKVEEHKKFISNLFEKAKSYDILDLTHDGIIYAGSSKKEKIIDDLPEKGQNMLTWIYNNFLDTKASEAIFALKRITDKLK